MSNKLSLLADCSLQDARTNGQLLLCGQLRPMLRHQTVSLYSSLLPQLRSLTGRQNLEEPCE